MFEKPLAMSDEIRQNEYMTEIEVLFRLAIDPTVVLADGAKPSPDLFICLSDAEPTLRGLFLFEAKYGSFAPGRDPKRLSQFLSARSAVRHWMSHMDGGDVCACWPADDHQTAWSLFESTVWTGCMAYPRIPFSATKDDTRHHAPKTASPFSVSMIQLAIFALTGQTRNACQKCGKTFSIQEGRSRKGQNRKVGVKYCSKNCSVAAAQAAWRRRQKESAA